MLTQHIGSCLVPGAARLGYPFRRLCASREETPYCSTWGLLVIRSRFTDLSATRARVSFDRSKATFLGARLWVLGRANDVHLPGLYRDIVHGRPACALRHATATGNRSRIFASNLRPVEKEQMKRKSIEKTPAMCESAVTLLNARAVTVACWLRAGTSRRFGIRRINPCRNSGGLPMKKVLWVLALCICSGNALFAQSFPGTWQGALKVPQAPNGEFRIILKI